jgi:hypothetical protein
MRPGKIILLVGENEFTLSTLRFILTHSRPSSSQSDYLVVTARSTQEAVDILRECSFDVLLCQRVHQYPIRLLDEFLGRCAEIAPNMRTIVTSDGTYNAPVAHVDVFLYKPSSAEIMDSIKILSARKRGPHKRQVSSVEVLA